MAQSELKKKSVEAGYYPPGTKSAGIAAILLDRARRDPEEPVSLAAISREVGASRELGWKVYHFLGEEADVSLPPVSNPGRPRSPATLALMEKVVPIYKEEGKPPYSEIARRLGVTEASVDHAIEKLHGADELPYRRPPKTEEERIKEVVVVARLYNRDLTYEEMKQQTGFDSGTLSRRIGRAEEDGLIERRRRPYRTGDEVVALRAQVAELRRSGLTRCEIHTRVNRDDPRVTLSDVNNAVHVLLQEGVIESRASGCGGQGVRNPKVVARDEKVRRWRNLGFSNPQITELLSKDDPEISQTLVEQSAYRLLSDRRIVPHRTGRKRALPQGLFTGPSVGWDEEQEGQGWSLPISE